MTLTKGPSGFEGRVRVPWGTKVHYKFIVDGNWTTLDGQPAERDPAGHWNNVFTAPPQPVSEHEPAIQETEPETTSAAEPVTTQPDDSPLQAPPVDPETNPEPEPETLLQVPTQERPELRFTSDSPAVADLQNSVSAPVPTMISETPSSPTAESPTSPVPPIAIVPPTPAPERHLSLPSLDDTPSPPKPFADEPTITTTVPTPDDSLKELANGSAPVTPAPPTKTPTATIGKKGGKFKFGKQTFPSSEEDPSSPTSSSRGSFRTKRHSFLLKLKHMFIPDDSDDDDSKGGKPKQPTPLAK